MRGHAVVDRVVRRVVVDDGGKPFVLAPDEGDIDSAYRCDDSMTHWEKQP